METVVTQCCRACLKISDIPVDMFRLKYGDTALSEMFRTCTSVQLETTSSLTTYICQNCIKDLVTSYTFIKKCQSTDLKLKSQDLPVIPTNSLVELQENGGHKLGRTSVESVKSEPAEIETSLGDVLSNKKEIEGDSSDIEDVKSNISCGVDGNFETSGSCLEKLNEVTARSVDALTCRECDIKFSSQLSWRLHMRVHGLRACQFCSKSFQQEAALEAHRLSHRVAKPYICSICNQSFNQKIYLNCHMRVHTQTTQYVCSDCGKSFKWLSSYKYHSCTDENSSRVSNSGRIYGCKICDKSFMQPAHWASHQRTHTGHRPYKCKLCDNAFMHLSSIRNHMSREHKIEYSKSNVEYVQDKNSNSEDIQILELNLKAPGTVARPFVCDICGKSFTQRAHWYTHQRIHTGHCPYWCKLCKTSYRHLSTVKTHMKRDHQQEFSRENLEFLKGPQMEKEEKTQVGKPEAVVKKTSFQCEICSEVFKGRSSLRHHTMLHTGERRHYCEVCGRGFIQRNALGEHMKKHTGETPYVCEHCNKRFRALTSYKEHLTIHFPPENPVPCEKCGKVLRSKQAWKRHQLTHNKKYLCNECGKCFTNKTKLTEHSNVHKGIKPYHCNICNKEFFRREVWKLHVMRHENVKPHQCGNCDKAFVMRSKLSEHIKKHHGDGVNEENHVNNSL